MIQLSHTASRINTITKLSNFSINEAAKVDFGSFDCGGDCEQYGVSVVKISDIIATSDDFWFETDATGRAYQR